MTEINWHIVKQELAGLDLITDPAMVAKLSLDYYHFSPILQAQLQDKRGELVVRPLNEAEVIQVAKTCVKHKIPLTIRGAGTGNYGQCIPLEGGIILDTSRLNQIISLKPGIARVEAGVRMAALDKEAREMGWELRMVPSTYRSATLGGFIGGGSVGAGSLNYGQIKERGNVLALRIVSLEDPPQILELRGDDVQKVLHAYGTNGMITELEIALAPAYQWAEMIVVFDDFIQSARFGQALCDSDGIVKKLVTILADPLPAYLTALKAHLPQGCSCALLMVAEPSLEALLELIEEYQGCLTYNKNSTEASKGISLLEFTWNHTTLHARSIDPNLTYLQTFYFTLEKVVEMHDHFGEEVMIHLEFLRLDGQTIPAGLPVVRFSTAQRLQEIIDYHNEAGAGIANPHTYLIEEGGNGKSNLEQLAFKSLVDPYGLMNPGKMRAWLEFSNSP